MIEIDNLSLMAAVSGPTIDPGTAITPGQSEARQFDFLVEPEESTTVVTTNEEEWDEFEDEE